MDNSSEEQNLPQIDQSFLESNLAAEQEVSDLEATAKAVEVKQQEAQLAAQQEQAALDDPRDKENWGTKGVVKELQ